MDNFKDISKGMMAAGAGIMVTGEDELFEKLDRILANPEEGRDMGDKGYKVIMANRGALKKNVDLVKEARGG